MSQNVQLILQKAGNDVNRSTMHLKRCLNPELCHEVSIEKKKPQSGKLSQGGEVILLKAQFFPPHLLALGCVLTFPDRFVSLSRNDKGFPCRQRVIFSSPPIYVEENTRAPCTAVGERLESDRDCKCLFGTLTALPLLYRRPTSGKERSRRRH